MKRIFLIIFLMSTLFSAFAQQVNVNPSIITFNLQTPGSAETQVLTLSNTSSKTETFEISIGDWNRKQDGSHDYFKPNTQPYSCASWITLSSSLVEIPAGKSAEVLITIQAPEKQEDLEKMKWAMLFIQGANLRKPITNSPKEAKAAVQEILRMGIHIYQTPANLTDKSARVLNFTPRKDNQRLYDFEMENTGKVMITGRAHLEITNIATSEETTTANIEFPVFPGGKRIVPIPIPAELKKGKYSVLAVLDYGENVALEAIEKTIEIK